MTATFQTAADVLEQCRDDILSGTAPTLYPVGTGDMGRLEVGPGIVTLLGGAPGAGKTAFVLQAVFDALRLTKGLKAAICNVEMKPAVMLERQLARVTGIDLRTIRRREVRQEDAGLLERGFSTLEEVADRICFCRPPFTLENVAAVADNFQPDLLVLDYIQRITPPGSHGDKRGSVDATMSYLRQFADAGMALIVVAALSRTKDAKGRASYAADGLSLASFRESSELEFGADDALILVPDTRADNRVILKHLKARNSEPKDFVLHFDRSVQRFWPVAVQEKGKRNLVEPEVEAAAA
jgi:replicative DNA helicase